MYLIWRPLSVRSDHRSTLNFSAVLSAPGENFKCYFSILSVNALMHTKYKEQNPTDLLTFTPYSLACLNIWGCFLLAIRNHLEIYCCTTEKVFSTVDVGGKKQQKPLYPHTDVFNHPARLVLRLGLFWAQKSWNSTEFSFYSITELPLLEIQSVWSRQNMLKHLRCFVGVKTLEGTVFKGEMTLMKSEGATEWITVGIFCGNFQLKSLSISVICVKS